MQHPFLTISAITRNAKQRKISEKQQRPCPHLVGKAVAMITRMTGLRLNGKENHIIGLSPIVVIVKDSIVHPWIREISVVEMIVPDSITGYLFHGFI